MTRAGEKLYRDDSGAEPRGCQYIAGFLIVMSLLIALAPLIRWVARLFG